jgi:hypothetical protein
MLGNYDVLLFGVWTINVAYTWNGPTTSIVTFMITFTPPSNPCFMAIAPPLSIASYTSNLSDLDFTVDVNPTFDSTYPSCLFSVWMVVTKSTSPDTSI